jgi:hypothetical protein
MQVEARGKMQQMTEKNSANTSVPVEDGRLQEVQLSRLRKQLEHLSSQKDLIKAIGQDPERFATDLAKQYSDLLSKQPKGRGPERPILSAKTASILDRLSDIFGLWERVQASNLTPVLVQTPPPAHTSGAVGAVISPGALVLEGDIFNSSPQEQFWVNTWQCAVPFPVTPSNFTTPASLSYRFNLGASVAFYRQSVLSGSVAVYVTVAKTSDLNAQPIDFTHPASSDFAIFANLPVPGVPPIIGGSVKVTGTIPLVPGKTPAIGILIGVIFGVAQGEVLIIPGEYSIVDFAPPGATSFADAGKVEFRRDQPFWVEAVAKQFT